MCNGKASKGQILRSGEILESQARVYSLEGAWRFHVLGPKLKPAAVGKHGVGGGVGSEGLCRLH